ncbi:hypothetical protein JR316_0002792 [Psilocybe cubensis]|uniref:Uncharacterized protein n=1 Tax=Psilocybe cubensis TaxID=181762 RepID=A0ACB8HE18_PSICU|nr:hypothetical protein JR316_0002792 [Psilocybe cubensis]KAH9485877.1 hypothetical protein JR316_0002792 [Psilocybe cubensis]
MEAIFDNKANVLDAKIRTAHDNSVIYSISTDQTTWSKTYTYVRDMNPAGREDPIVVGIINWDKKTFEVNGHRKTLKEIRRKPRRFSLRSKLWKWSEDREEYAIVHREEGWQAMSTSKNQVEATLAVPYRPQLFGKLKPIVINLSRSALAKDEVFLILAFIYLEYRRQEKTEATN